MWPFCFRTLACFARHHFAAPAICACDAPDRVIITISIAKQICPTMSFSSGSKRVAVIATGWLFILLGIAAFFTGNFFNGLWSIFIGWFLLNAAQTANMQILLQNTLQGVSVDKVMNPRPVAVPANISLQKLVNEYFVPQGLQAAPVVRGEYLAGLITLTDIARVERERWAYTPVGHVMRLLEQVYVTTPEQPLHDLLEVMVTRGINQIPVVQDGRLVGLLSRESILRYLQVRQSLKMDEPRYAL